MTNEFDNMIALLDAAWLLRSEIVPCLVGPPGIGKTAAVMQHAKAHGCGKVVKIVASRCIPSETVGMTMPDHEHRSMAIYNSMQLSSLEDGDILFLDELLEAEQFVLSTLLTVIESREMADGTPLPDVQIIAATNDTVSPEMLKGNIRQRFMFKRFHVDEATTHDYILGKTGIDLNRDLLRMLTDKGNDYNFLTPRSLTKLCMWVDAAPDEDSAYRVAKVIDSMWGATIGTMIWRRLLDRNRKLTSPEEQVREKVRQMVPETAAFADCSMSELVDYLKKVGYWDKVSKVLSETEIVEHDDKQEVDIQF